MSQEMPPSVTAVIPTCNNLHELSRCLASLIEQSHLPRRVLVCVDGSTDGTLEHLSSIAEGPLMLQVLTHPGNAHRGRAATRNLAFDLLGVGYTWFVDSDMVLDPDALSQHLMVAGSQTCTSVGAVIYANAQDAAWAGYLNSRGRHRRPNRGVLPFTQFTTANSLVRSEHVRKLGGFDERFEAYGGEDLDFAYRLERLSVGPLINNKLAIARTVENKTVEAALSQFERYGATNLRLLEQLHPGLPKTFQLHRLGSTGLIDRTFVAAANSVIERLVRAMARIAPRQLRNHLLNYLVIAAVWRGYRTSHVDK